MAALKPWTDMNADMTIIVFSALRVYALWRRSIWWPTIVLLLNAVVVGMELVRCIIIDIQDTADKNTAPSILTLRA